MVIGMEEALICIVLGQGFGDHIARWEFTAVMVGMLEEST